VCCDADSESWDGAAMTDSTQERASATSLSCSDMSYDSSKLGYEIEGVELPR
jgi:hypothetical protein